MHGRNPTRREKELIKKWRLNPANWLVIKSTPDYVELVQRYSSKRRRIPEGVKF